MKCWGVQLRCISDFCEFFPIFPSIFSGGKFEKSSRSAAPTRIQLTLTDIKSKIRPNTTIKWQIINWTPIEKFRKFIFSFFNFCFVSFFEEKKMKQKENDAWPRPHPIVIGCRQEEQGDEEEEGEEGGRRRWRGEGEGGGRRQKKSLEKTRGLRANRIRLPLKS